MNSSNQNDQAYLLECMKSLLPIANLSTDIHHIFARTREAIQFSRGDDDRGDYSFAE